MERLDQYCLAERDEDIINDETTVRTVINGPSRGSGQAEEVLNGFEGVALDAEAEAAAEAAYEAGGKAAADAAEDDPDECFVRVGETGDPFRGELIPPVGVEEFVPFSDGEVPWRMLGSEGEGGDQPSQG